MQLDTTRIRRSSWRGVAALSDAERGKLDPALREVVEYRKSGLSVNWIVGCPLDCGCCVRHLFGNFATKSPRALTSDEEAFERLVGHRFFRPDHTPIQLLNRATDPMLPLVKPHTFAMLRLLDEAGLRNHALLITRWRVDDADCAELDSYRNLRVTLLVTYSGIDDDRIEPVDSTIAAASLRTAFDRARRFRVVLYWRPIVPGLNDTDAHLGAALELSGHAHATVFTGLFYRDQIRDYYRKHGLPEPYSDAARRKILPEQLERRILTTPAPPQPPRPRRPRLARPSGDARMTLHPPNVLADRDLVVVDVEGNGQQPPEIIEIAVLPLSASGSVPVADLQTWLIKPRLPITPVVTQKVHGIRDRDVVDSPAWPDVADDIARALVGRVVVAHHASVERRLLGTHLPAWHPPLVLDTLRLAKRVSPGLDGGYGLDRLILRADLPGPPSEIGPDGAGMRRHRAGHDAWMTAGLLIALIEHAGLDWDGLVAAARLPETQATAELQEEGLW